MSDSKEPNRFPCPGCSAGMEFDPASKALQCPYCGSTVAVQREASAPGVPEMPYERYARAAEGDLSVIAQGALEFTCSSCGATVQFQPPEVAGACPFCAARIVVQAKSAHPLIAPQGVLPFKLSKAQSSDAVQTWLHSLWFAPNALKEVAKAEGLSGVYVPFWSFDARTETSYSGRRGEYYYVEQVVTVMVNGKPQQQVQRVRHTRWYPASGRVEAAFDDLLQPATKAVDNRRLAALEPWDLAHLESYEPGYLAGFKAQRYQVELPDAYDRARQMMEPVILAAVRGDIGGDEQQIHQHDTRYHDVTFRHLMLPVWVGAYRFQGKPFQITVNARTGEVQGERPYSAAKIALLIAAILLVIVVIARFSN